jgi:hypothetical protein
MADGTGVFLRLPAIGSAAHERFDARDIDGGDGLRNNF